MLHSILSELNQEYILPFSKLFENHVTHLCNQVAGTLYTEDDLKNITLPNGKTPDILLSYPECNLFIEAKSGIFPGSTFTAGHTEQLSRKTRALKKAFGQGWGIVEGLQSTQLAAAQVLNATDNFLLVVTNKELGAGRGDTLAAMYPEGKLNYPSSNAEVLLPLKHIYTISIEDFERLIEAAKRSDLYLPDFIKVCVEANDSPENHVFFMSQHLDRAKVPLYKSALIEDELNNSMERLKGIIKTD